MTISNLKEMSHQNKPLSHLEMVFFMMSLYTKSSVGVEGLHD